MNQGTTQPAGVPIQLRLVARQSSYRLDLGGKTPEQLEQMAQQSLKPHLKVLDFPTPPAVDLSVEIHNVGTRPLQILLGGTMHGMLIHVEGPGALNFTPCEPVLAALFPPQEITLAPGATHTVAVSNLPVPELPAFACGRKLAYWTRAGDHVLTAHWTAGVSPRPEGSKEVEAGPPDFGYVQVVSNPVTVHVTT